MKRFFFFACVTMLCLFHAGTVQAQLTQAAGIDVDAMGVVRMQRVTDPSGQLTRQRLMQSKAELDPQLARPSKLRKVSLNRLEAAIKAADQNFSGLSDEMRYLAGLTKIQYVFVYPETGDVVIAGPAEGYTFDLVGNPIGVSTGRSVLELQDLVAALRCFPRTGAAASSIGCSIDPTPEGLQNMQNFLTSIAGRVAPNDDVHIAKGLKESLGPQVVTVRGVPESTHFARVMVEADYRMKLIGIGLEDPPVKITSYVQRANPANVARNAMQRWYFVPDYKAVKMSDDSLAMELVGEGVKLIGEQEYVSQHGQRAQAVSVDRASQIFVRSFTEKYKALAARVPVFAQLRNLIDMSIVAAYMQENDTYGQSGWEMDFFGDESQFSIETYSAPQQVESAVNVVWKRNVLMTPIGGGVQVDPKLALRSDNLINNGDEAMIAAKQQIDLGEVPADRWWWD